MNKSVSQSKMSRKAKLLEQASRAETQLVMRSFKEAELSSLELLQSVTYIPGSESELQRAAFVFVQALFEQGRYKEVLPVLEQQYGGVHSIDFEVMMLWVALAVDAKMTLEAASVLDNYIKMRRITDHDQLSADQSAVAARMYAVELLTREAGRWKEAEAWLQDSAPLTPDQRKQIVGELADIRKKSHVSQAVEPGTPKQPTERALWTGSSNVQIAEGGADLPQAAPLASPEEHAAQIKPPIDAKCTEVLEHSAGCSAAIQPGSAEAAGSSRDVASSSGAQGSSSQVTWYHDLSRWWSEGEGLAGLSQSQLAALAAGGAVVLYAVMAERRALLSGARKVAGGVLGSISEVARLALQLNPNPVAAAMAARR